MRNRKGSFYIDFKLIDKEPEKAAEILRIMNFLPLRVEAMFMYGSISYEGLSPMFPEVSPYRTVPFYDIEIVMDEEKWPIDVLIKGEKNV